MRVIAIIKSASFRKSTCFLSAIFVVPGYGELQALLKAFSLLVEKVIYAQKRHHLVHFFES